MTVFAELRPRPDRIIRVTRGVYQGEHRLGIREYSPRPLKGPDYLRASQKGVSVRLEHIPTLRAALQAAELEALETGDLTEEHYLRAGVEPPALVP